MKVVEDRAPQVCSTCKIRKKRCDKGLPSCGYCAKRNLRCQYEESPPTGTDRDTTGFPEISANAMLLQMVSLFGPSPENLPVRPTDRICHHISDRYFRNFHKWLPIISPRLFCTAISAYNDRLESPPADLSVLLLAMCLVTLQPSNDSSTASVTPPGLHRTVKVVFAETQSMMCTSTRLLQASVLIAAYEYANGRPEAAHITMGTCTRIGYVDGLQHSRPLQTDLAGSRWSNMEEIERYNLWWGILILERLVLCEVEGNQQRPATEYPSPGAFLPSDLYDDGDDTYNRLTLQNTNLRMPNIHVSNPSNFGRQAEAVYLLDQVLAVQRLPQDDRSRISEFRRLDECLQGFLTMVMGTDTVKIGHGCSGIAPAVRALFLIHQDILRNPSGAIDVQWLHYSESVLKTVATVVVDVARHHNEQITCNNAHADLLPLNCSYNLHLAMRCVQDCVEISGRTRRSGDLDTLAQLDQEFSNRWKAGRHQEPKARQNPTGWRWSNQDPGTRGFMPGASGRMAVLGDLVGARRN
ncbi:hypothetical protein BO70DRAFT_386079 [Aspergillus heteromorphus CBS 117.55]|uniref:Zn(2)-C6 fungal-type domain-containing protein n=1 Tax=Aspergillus heteromorphus CBS 117.55 TaxID=1448321 RepID=A0A317WKB1_9EURO|nr:uncharacterized protein BO70DRAFT_386079 [Aspergillus heteromorphus CBS 117.55]PWY86779.1 hypothetical protein BO70DRAFT_386079 [Aspergillus heteromorphus CBS 117.55]